MTKDACASTANRQRPKREGNGVAGIFSHPATWETYNFRAQTSSVLRLYIQRGADGLTAREAKRFGIENLYARNLDLKKADLRIVHRTETDATGKHEKRYFLDQLLIEVMKLARART